MKKLLILILTALLATSVGWAENLYVKVESTSQLEVGKTYILVYENGNSSACMGAIDNKYGQAIKNMALNNKTIDIDGMPVLELTLGGSTDAWTFHTGSGYLATTNDKDISVKQEVNNYSQWKVTESFTLVLANNSARKLQYNSSSPRFTTYSSAQKPAYLYVKQSSSPTLTCAAPTFSPDGGSSTTGSLDVTITSATDGATIYYTTDNSDPVVNRATSSIANGGTVHLTESCTLKAMAVKSGMDNSAIVTSQSYTITSGGGQPSLSTLYRKVTSASDLVDGQKYILVYENGPAYLGAISTTSTKYGLSITGPEISNHTVDIAGYSDIKELTLTKDGDNLSFNNGDGYLCWNSGNSLNTETSITDNSKWIASGDATNGYILTNVVKDDTNSRILKYNTGSPRFACYTSGQQPAILYVQENSDAPKMTVNPASLTINDNGTASAGTAVRTGEIAVSAQNLTNDISVSKVYNANNNNYWTVNPSSISKDATFPQNLTVAYSGKALSSTEIVTFHTATDGVNDVIVPVDYLYTGPIYIMGNVNQTGWASDNGVAMTRDASTGTYSKTLTLLNSGDGYAYISFTKALGSTYDAIVNDRFGPVSSGDWHLNESTLGQDCALDTTGAYWSIKMPYGDWEVTITPSSNTFRLVPHVPAPAFSPAAGRYETAQEVTITCPNTDAHIYYTTDGSTPSATNGTLYSGPVTISTTSTLKAVAVYGGYSSTVTSTDYIIKAIDGDDYVLTNTVSANDEYVLVYSSNTTDYAMGAFNSSNYYATTTSSSDFELNGTIVYRKNNNVNVITLEPAGAADTYYIVDQDGYYLYYNSGNYVHRNAQLATDNDAYKWKVTIDENDNVSIQNVGTTDRYLRCNAQNSRYSCYNSGQNDAKLYKRAISEPRIRVSENSLDLGTVEAGGASVSKTFTVHGMNLTQDVTLSIEGENFTVSPTTISAADANNGYVTVTVTYSGLNASANATVTVNSQCDPKTVAITAARELLAVTISPEATGFTGRVLNGTISANNENATIYYSFDGENFVQYDGGFSAELVTVGESVTVYAYAVYNGETSPTVSKTYTREPKANNLFTKVTNDDQIKAGNKYIIVYEENPGALYGNGYEDTSVTWENGRINIAGTNTYVFTLDGPDENNQYQFKIDIDGTTNYLTHNGTGGNSTAYTTTPKGLTITSTYTLADSSYYMSHNGSGNTFRWYNSGSNGTPVYLYTTETAIEAPEITPASGDYYDSQSVKITADDGDRVFYTIDGSDPATSSTRVEYTGPFIVSFDANSPTTVKAIAVDDEGNVSDPAEATYTWITPSVVISPDSRNVITESVTVTMTGAPTNATIYYTTDGNEPTTASEQYSGAFTVSLPNVGDVVNVKAIAVYNGQTSEVATATYTRVEKVIEVKTPFFSPLAGTNGGYNGIYYGEQTLQIGCTTPNADIYYEIEEVTGETAPATVADPTKQSSYYDATQTITMEEGKSYRVKAIAYVGGFASTITEGYYIIKSFSDFQNEHSGDGYTYVANCAEFNALTSTGANISFTNPVQVVYHSTYANNGTMAEFCYVRDNTDYACIYFGKRDTHNYHIFKMGDWIDGYNISGEMNIWENNYHNQLGTSDHTIEYWPSEALGWSEIIPTPTTCNAISSGTTAPGHNLWGNYVHLRNTTLSDVADYASDDPKHKGTITDASGSDTYYDKFYLWSAGTCSYSGYHDVIQHLGDYDQAFFTAKQNAGATFDVYGIVDYYKPYDQPFEVCPIDFLWTYKPVITVNPGETVTGQVDTYAVPQTVTISAEQPEWAAENVVIYYKTDEMDDWAEYNGPFVVSSTTSVQTYAEVYAKKNDAAETDYNDYVRSVTVSQDFFFQGIKDPIITPSSEVIEVINGTESRTVTIKTHPDSSDGTVTLYTINDDVPTLDNGEVVTDGEITLDPITTTTTVTAISYLPDANGNPVLWSNPVTETYTFVKKNGVIYDLLTTAPKEGNVYVIVNKDAYMGMSTKQNENNRGSVGVMFTDDTKAQVYGNDELALFVLEKATADRYYFKNINGDGYLTVAGNTGLKTGAKDTYAEAGIVVGAQADGYPATITFSNEGSPRVMRYFAKGRTFSTYADATLNENIFLYGVNATPLRYIEGEMKAGDDVQVTVSDQLIGTWAVKNLLWAKDQGYANVKTYAAEGQMDYVKDILKYQRNEGWDQSNWVILDFTEAAGGALKAAEFVGKKIEMASVTGTYVDDVNYTIRLEQAPALAKDDNGKDIDVSGDYPGYRGGMGGENYNPQAATEGGTGDYSYAYNTYLPANFLNSNLNLGDNEGFVAQADAAAPSHVGERLFFINPKVMEVARIWAVYAGTNTNGKDLFTVYEPDQQNVNGWGVEGAFTVEWTYNRLDGNNPNYNIGRPNIDEKVNEAFLFHAVVANKDAIENAPLRAATAPQGEADSTPSMSEDYVLYPLDFPSDGSNYTAVVELSGVKTVESVRYYNIMGMESEKPFEGVNIVVTRYSDGSASTIKVLR